MENQSTDGGAPIFFASDSHHPPPSEFRNILLQLAENRPAERMIWQALATAMKEAQVFDFGRLDDKKLVSESFRGAELYTLDHLRMPFRSVVFQYDVTLDLERAAAGLLALNRPEREIPSTQRYITLAIDADAWGLNGVRKRMIVACDWLDIASDPDISRHFAERLPTRARSIHLLAAAGYFQMMPGEYRWHGNLMYPLDVPDEKTKADALGGLGDGVIGLSMILATRGIPVRVIEPSVKLNAKRARSGKEPLVRVTHVDTALYYEAMANTKTGGTHASPVPHLRRGHIRKLGGDRTTWVSDCVVNCSSPAGALERSHYEVET